MLVSFRHFLSFFQSDPGFSNLMIGNCMVNGKLSIQTQSCLYNKHLFVILTQPGFAG